ncbi:restriction endonuclease [Haladaptatus salinisoli]|uniref:restriction endonuclease n=1 Tax=Haladaptatus salinisoli TaxID=2884876 RepID=UPI001D0B5765|nr:restriction endonuclease [Haladaptatus salinisoli]
MNDEQQQIEDLIERNRPPEWDSRYWKAYQQLVAAFYQTEKDVRAEEEYPYPLNTADESDDIDVVLWDNSGAFETVVLIECKFKGRNIDKGVVRDLGGSISDSDAHRGVIISKQGFQSGAIKRAESKGIDLWILRTIDPENDFEDLIRMIEAELNIENKRINNNSIETHISPVEKPEDLESLPDGESRIVEHHNSRLYN